MLKAGKNPPTDSNGSMPDQPFYLDQIFTAEKGIDSGLSPLLLEKTKLSFGQNISVRGAFISPRPVLRKVELTFQSASIQTGVEDGLWQGGAYYKPDSGSESLFAAISGRLFQFTPDAGQSATVGEQTIPGDPNPPDAIQAWLWQSENFLIWNDGQSTPVFFDGFSSRRSISPGSTLTINNVNGVPGTNVPIGTGIWIRSSAVGISYVSQTFPSGVAVGADIVMTTSTVGPVAATFVTAGSYIWQLISQTANTLTLRALVALPAGTTLSGSGSTVTQQGTTVAAFVTPVIGAPVPVSVSSTTFVYPAGDVVFVGNPFDGYTFVSFAYVASGELPPGRMGVYGLGRNWVCLTDGRSFVGSDIVGGSSGTAPYNDRDSVLHITENTYLAGGGVFVVPGNVGDIRAMIFAATLDASLGQGPLQIFTPNIVFSVNAPVVRTTTVLVPTAGSNVNVTQGWQDIENPILTQSIISFGGLGQHNTVIGNSDTLFRAIDGVRSLILARREFATWGNTPISHEMERILVQDSTALLQFGSAIVFDNRLLMSAKPTPSDQGYYHPGTMALNFDTISSIQGKAPSVWEGLWLGVNSLQWVRGMFNGVERAFAFSLNTVEDKIELYELLSDERVKFDSNGHGEVRITWAFETACLFKDIKGKGLFDLVKLQEGEFYLGDVVGQVDFQVFYRPQFAPCWVPWHSGSICAEIKDPADPADVNVQAQNRVAIGLGVPSSKDCDPVNNRPYIIGETFQFRFVFTGSARFYGAVFKASPEPKRVFARAQCEPICIDANESDCEQCKRLDCAGEDIYALYQLQDAFIPVVPQVLFNQPVYFVHECPEGETLVFTGTLPSWISLDSENTRLVGAAGTYQAASTAGANALAQNALNEFGNAAVAAAELDCEGGTDICADGLGDLVDNIYGITGYVDGLIANPNSNPTGNPLWDGEFSFFVDNGIEYGWTSGEFDTQTMEGDNGFCIHYLFFTCAGDIPTWTAAFGDTSGTFWRGEKVGGQTPEGTYARVSGTDPGPASIDIELVAGTTTQTVNEINCGS